MIFFRFSKNLGFWLFLVHPTVVSVLLSASVERCFVSRMRDFLDYKRRKQSLQPLVVMMSIFSEERGGSGREGMAS